MRETHVYLNSRIVLRVSLTPIDIRRFIADAKADGDDWISLPVTMTSEVPGPAVWRPVNALVFVSIDAIDMYHSDPKEV